MKKLLDGTCTSPAWAQAAPKVCVFPVGAFEQHSRHLPLASDDIGAQYFGEFVARELGAALLPTLNYGTSLEQTGFKGTVTLRPETLMQDVRDVAAEVEEQGFAVMIILNGHGGNHVLAPVARDINRRNGKLKILVVNHYEFADWQVLDGPKQGKTDLHSGEFETSLLLAIVPELVGKERPDSRTSPRSASATSRPRERRVIRRWRRARRASCWSRASNATSSPLSGKGCAGCGATGLMAGSVHEPEHANGCNMARLRVTLSEAKGLSAGRASWMRKILRCRSE